MTAGTPCNAYQRVRWRFSEGQVNGVAVAAVRLAAASAAAQLFFPLTDTFSPRSAPSLQPDSFRGENTHDAPYSHSRGFRGIRRNRCHCRGCCATLLPKLWRPQTQQALPVLSRSRRPNLSRVRHSEWRSTDQARACFQYRRPFQLHGYGGRPPQCGV